MIYRAFILSKVYLLIRSYQIDADNELEVDQVVVDEFRAKVGRDDPDMTVVIVPFEERKLGSVQPEEGIGRTWGGE